MVLPVGRYLLSLIASWETSSLVDGSRPVRGCRLLVAQRTEKFNV